jgi:FkbM family methyltransferase
MLKLTPRNIARNIRRDINCLLGKDFKVTPAITCDSCYLGSEYGGWAVVHNQVDANSVIYSIGVGEDISFDLAMIERFGVQVQAFDPTPKSIQWVKQQNVPTLFKMHEYGIADFDGEVSFNPPENSNHVSHTLLERTSTSANAIKVPVLTLASMMEKLGHKHIDLLKMDVEGAEYQVIESLIKTSHRPSQFLIEFHHRFPQVGVEKTRKAISQLNQMGYKLFDVSSSGEEFSFIHSSAIKQY